MKALTYSLLNEFCDVSIWVTLGLRESLPIPRINGTYHAKSVI